MKNKLFVGNLSWKVSEDELRSVFEKCGAVVSVKIITDQMTGKSRGFAFVVMETEEGADEAIRVLNETAVLDRNIRVSHAQERPEGQGNGGGGGRSFDRRSGGGERSSGSGNYNSDRGGNRPPRSRY